LGWDVLVIISGFFSFISLLIEIVLEVVEPFD
jgi:hypothetical protein